MKDKDNNKKYFQSMAEDFESVLNSMSGLNIHYTIAKKEEKPDPHYALAYACKFKHAETKRQGIIYLGFNEVECANSVAMSIANRAGMLFSDTNRDDFLCELANTCIGKALTNLEKKGFSATFEPASLIDYNSLNVQHWNADTSVVVVALDVSYLFFEVVFIGELHEKLVNKRILIVDDSMMIRNLLAKKLASIGFIVETAVDGMEAVEKAEEFNPHLIIMDHVMPRLNGLDAIFFIRQFSPSTKFIMLSSISRVEELETAKDLKVEGYLTKPLNLELLYNTMSDALLK